MNQLADFLRIPLTASQRKLGEARMDGPDRAAAATSQEILYEPASAHGANLFDADVSCPLQSLNYSLPTVLDRCKWPPGIGDQQRLIRPPHWLDTQVVVAPHQSVEYRFPWPARALQTRLAFLPMDRRV